MFKKNIPNFITLLNLLCGSIGVVFAMSGDLETASWLVALAALFDFLDGMVARMLKVKSEIGKELDSLADVISFGLLPGTIIYGLLLQNPGTPQLNVSEINLFPFIGFLILLFSALRLAKFNTDRRQSDVFLGMPTPANGLLIASFPLILAQHTNWLGLEMTFLKVLINCAYFLIALTFLLSWLLVAGIPLMSLKFKNMGWNGNEPRYIFLGLLVILFGLFYVSAVPMIIFLYVILSLVFKNSIQTGEPP